MNWERELDFDPCGMALVRIARHFLTTYFSHPHPKADELVSKFFVRFPHADEDYVHHQSSWALANSIHFTVFLGGDLGEVIQWQVEVNDSLNAPEEAEEYMRTHFWNRFEAL